MLNLINGGVYVSVEKALGRDEIAIENVLVDGVHKVLVEAPVLSYLLETHKLLDGRVLVDELDDLGLNLALFGERVQHARSLQLVTLEHDVEELVHVSVHELVAVGLVGHERDHERQRYVAYGLGARTARQQFE